MGKTHVTAQMVKAYVDHGSINRVFLVSPTYHTNSHLWAWCGVQPQDAYLKVDEAEAALRHIVQRIRDEQHAWRTHQTWRECVALKRARKPMTSAQRMVADGVPPPDVPLPRPIVILDDLSHSKVMSSRYLINLTLRSRHVAHNPQIGLSMVFLVQSLKAGIPRVLRSNVSAWIVFGTKGCIHCNRSTRRTQRQSDQTGVPAAIP